MASRVVQLFSCHCCINVQGDDNAASMDRACLRLASAGFAEPGKAKESLHKLAAMRDNNIFKSLAAALDPAASPAAASKAAKDALSRIGTKGAIGDMAKSVSFALPLIEMGPVQHWKPYLWIASILYLDH